MKFIRQRVLAREFVAGTWCNLGSSLTAEMAALAGFDWVLLDLEHGCGDLAALVPQLQAVSATPATPIVRVSWNDMVQMKRVLDLGAAGVMVPYVNTPDEARAVAAAMRYPPDGVRGAAKMTRASGFGYYADEYLRRANDELLTVVQVETEQAVAHAPETAALDGVDVLFIGPTDLSLNMGIPQQLDAPKFRDGVARVVAAARNAGKAAGILLASPAQVPRAVDDGFTFVALSSDGSMVAAGMKAALEALRAGRRA
jgi:2-keto-3-deoxy-L-rhamnonate aldolase RhmA